MTHFLRIFRDSELLRKLRAWWERLCDDTVRKLP